MLLEGLDLAGAEVGGCGVDGVSCRGGGAGSDRAGVGDNGGRKENGKENERRRSRSRSSNGAGITIIAGVRVSRPIKAEAFSFAFSFILPLPGGDTKRSRGQTARVPERGRGADGFVVLVDGGREGEEGSWGGEGGGGERAIGEIDGGCADGAEGVGACGRRGEEGWGVVGPDLVEGFGGGDGGEDGVDHCFGVDGVGVVFVVVFVDDDGGGGSGGGGGSVGGGRGRHAADAAADGTYFVSIEIC